MADVEKEIAPILFSSNNDTSSLRYLLRTHSLPQHGRKYHLLARLTLLSCLGEDHLEPASLVIKGFEDMGLVNETACLWGATTAELIVEADRLGVVVGEGSKQELVRDIMLKRIMKCTSYRNAMMGVGIRDVEVKVEMGNDGDRVNTEIQAGSIDSSASLGLSRGLASSIHASSRREDEDEGEDSLRQRVHSGGNDSRGGRGGGRGRGRGRGRGDGRLCSDNKSGGRGRGERGMGGGMRRIYGDNEDGGGMARPHPDIRDAVNSLEGIMGNGRVRLFGMIEEHRHDYGI